VSVERGSFVSEVGFWEPGKAGRGLRGNISPPELYLFPLIVYFKKFSPVIYWRELCKIGGMFMRIVMTPKELSAGKVGHGF